jgi:hypothetical protein
MCVRIEYFISCYLCLMEMINFMFRIGVLFAIYGFIWGLIEIGIALLSAGRKRSTPEIYIIRALKYFFLADVTFLFCIDTLNGDNVVVNQLIIAGLLLLTYFVGKLQNNQNKQQLFNVAMGSGFKRFQTGFNIRAELIIISLALGVFITFYFIPSYASNPVSLWFLESIINIEDTPIFGFVFRVIGFFFILALFFRMSNTIGYLLSGQAFRDAKNSPKSDQRDDHFDDYTEVN